MEWLDTILTFLSGEKEEDDYKSEAFLKNAIEANLAWLEILCGEEEGEKY